MPRQIVPQVERNFIGGLITEATALNFPENACTETDNCVFYPKGEIYRRLGMDYEDGYVSRTVARSLTAMSTFVWMNPAGEDKTFLVVQIGRYLYFYNATNNAAVSAGAHATVIDMDSYKTSTATLLAQNECQFAAGQGYLFVVHPYAKPFYVSYTASGDSLASSGIDVKVRDTEGIVDELGYVYDTRPTALTDKHTYNLYNQGWFPGPYKDPATYSNPTDYPDRIKRWRSNSYYYGSSGWVAYGLGRTDYPSNADVWYTMKNSLDMFDPTLADQVRRGNTPAPKGYFVLDAWDMDRTTASTLTIGAATAGGGYLLSGSAPDVITLSGIPSTTSGVHRPSTIAFHAGRVFYAGVSGQNYSNKIFFTQVIKNEEQFGRCYQLNDPTNDILFDLLDTDGGTITIPDMGRVVKLFSIQTSLIVFATNGVWVISGNQNIAFSAGDYSVRKVSSIPAIDSHSFVDVEGLPCWWNYDGIYMVTEVNNAGGVKIDSLTQMSIRTYYKEEIPVNAKLYATGAYNQLTKEIRWLWRAADVSTFEQNFEYDRALTFNTLTKAFYPWSFDTTLARVCGIASVRTQGTERLEIDGAMEDVTSTLGSVFKYVISNTGGTSITFGETKDSTYTDFKTVDGDGVDFESYFITGYKEDAGGAARRSQSNYLILFVRFQDNPEFYIRGVFDFANASSSMRWGANQLIQFPELGDYDYVTKKVKIRGTGRSIQFKVTSVTGKPFDIVGWSRWQTANAGI